MRDLKVNEVKNQQYFDFKNKFEKAALQGYIPCGVDKLMAVHGTAIYKAYQSQCKN